jgi:hypothetical protein
LEGNTPEPNLFPNRLLPARTGTTLQTRSIVQALYELVPIIANIIAAHCLGTGAREHFVHACLGADWEDTRAMIEGMLAEPWHLVGYQERRLREFLELVRLQEGAVVQQ